MAQSLALTFNKIENASLLAEWFFFLLGVTLCVISIIGNGYVSYRLVKIIRASKAIQVGKNKIVFIFQQIYIKNKLVYHVQNWSLTLDMKMIVFKNFFQTPIYLSLTLCGFVTGLLSMPYMMYAFYIHRLDKLPVSLSADSVAPMTTPFLNMSYVTTHSDYTLSPTMQPCSDASK